MFSYLIVKVFFSNGQLLENIGPKYILMCVCSALLTANRSRHLFKSTTCKCKYLTTSPTQFLQIVVVFIISGKPSKFSNTITFVWSGRTEAFADYSVDLLLSILVTLLFARSNHVFFFRT